MKLRQDNSAASLNYKKVVNSSGFKGILELGTLDALFCPIPVTLVLPSDSQLIEGDHLGLAFNKNSIN
jgi:hypothetical protein